MLRKDNFYLGLVLAIFAPMLGLLLFKLYKYGIFTFKETFQYMMNEPGYRTLTVALSLSLLLNALLFTVYLNSSKDNTAKGIFVTTVVYGLIILSIKTFT